MSKNFPTGCESAVEQSFFTQDQVEKIPKNDY